MISIENLCKQYGSQVLFEDISFNLNSRERIGLVGRNGHGKSTLFKILTGQETADSGKIRVPSGYRTGYLDQHINFTKATVLDEACTGLPEGEELNSWKAEKILSGLGFTEEDFQLAPSSFSGGFQLRINLAKAILGEPNLLLLDEPTNFLDILSIRWMINFLKSWKSELIIISHDRNFMDSVVTDIVGIHRSTIKKIKGTTETYYDKVAEEEELYERQRMNTDKKRADMEQFVNRFKAKASKAKLVQSRVKALDKMEKSSKLDNIADMRFSFNTAPFPAKRILEITDLSFSYDKNGPMLIDNFNLTVGSNDRICIIGKNGKGKTTLLKLIANKLKPATGEIKYHPQAKMGYFEQTNTAGLTESMTIEEEMLDSHPTGERKAARGVCGAMMFSGDLALKKTSVLSGGEKCRVMLGKILLTPTNILLLDEPTNHLDMQSCGAMGSAIAAFDGATIIISHSEDILRKVANRLIVFHDDRIFVYEGNYDGFLEDIGWGDEDGLSQRGAKGEKPAKRLPKKELKKLRADFVQRRSAVLSPLKKKISALEGTIEKLEEEISKLNDSLAIASGENNGQAVAELSQKTQKLNEELDSHYKEMNSLVEDHDRHKVEFETEEEKLLKR